MEKPVVSLRVHPQLKAKLNEVAGELETDISAVVVNATDRMLREYSLAKAQKLKADIDAAADDETLQHAREDWILQLHDQVMYVRFGFTANLTVPNPQAPFESDEDVIKAYEVGLIRVPGRVPDPA